MQITRQADYALRAVMYLAQIGDAKRAATNQIAKQQGIPPSFLAKIISQLSLAGLIQTSRGARGGVSLAKQPEEITILEVIEAIDGPIILSDCTIHKCGFGERCPLQRVMCKARNELVEILGSATFAVKA